MNGLGPDLTLDLSLAPVTPNLPQPRERLPLPLPLSAYRPKGVKHAGGGGGGPYIKFLLNLSQVWKSGNYFDYIVHGIVTPS